MSASTGDEAYPGDWSSILDRKSSPGRVAKKSCSKGQQTTAVLEQYVLQGHTRTPHFAGTYMRAESGLYSIYLKLLFIREEEKKSL